MARTFEIERVLLVKDDGHPPHGRGETRAAEHTASRRYGKSMVSTQNRGFVAGK